MATLIEMDEDHWDMVGRRMRRALIDRIVAVAHREAFEKLLATWERVDAKDGPDGPPSVEGVPNELALEIVKAIRHRWGEKDAELAPIADAIEAAALASIARKEE